MNILMLATVGAISFGCSKSTHPKQVKDLVYVFATGNRLVYILDADSLTVQDSITGFKGQGYNPVEDMVVTPDGRWLFTTGEQGQTEENLVRKINTATKQIVATLGTPHPGRLVLLNRGHLLLWGGCDGIQTTVDEFPGGSKDTTEVCVQNGPLTGGTIAGGVAGTNHIRTERVQPRTALAEFVATLIDSVPVSSVYYVALHPDGMRVSALVGRGGKYYFVIAEVTTGRTIFQNALASPPGWFAPGEIAINSCGTLAVVTDPGKPRLEEYVGTIDVVDLITPRLLKRLDQRDFGFVESNGQIAITSDEKAAIIAAPPGGGGIPVINRLDLTRLAIVRSAVTPDTGTPGALAVGPAPDQ